MLKEIVIAIQSYFEAHNFIRAHRLWKWIIIPGILYTILFIIGMYFFWQSSDNAVTWLSRQIGIEAWLQRQRNEWLNFLFMMIGLILRLVLVFFYFSLFKYLFLIIGSPVFAYLSEKTESILEGKDFPFSLPQLLRDAWRGIKIALRNTLWQTVYAISLLLLSLLPVFGWIAPLIALFIECYYYGFSMLDYSCERNRLSFGQSINFIGRHRGLAIGNGLIFYLMHAIILVGWVLAPAYAVVAATLSVHRIKTA
ncbi:MAG: EI24 domain-containing protein [Chitinophagaceae bacterium]|nr:EI24 domain-containing protein [Chitinophagaceae bacterium]